MHMHNIYTYIIVFYQLFTKQKKIIILNDNTLWGLGKQKYLNVLIEQSFH